MKGQSQVEIYRSCEPVVDAAYDASSDRSLLEVLVEALATAGDVDPTELPPLYETIDVDAITELFSGRSGNVGDAVLGFRVDDWNVFIRDDGRIRICDRTKTVDPAPVFESTLL